MSNKKTDSIRIVKGSERYAGSADTNLSLNVDLTSDRNELVEKDRTKVINLAQQFDDERQISNSYRISGKITNIFKNNIFGTSSYPPFLNSLYYVDPEITIENQSPFKGYPPADEFDFIRTTIPPQHKPFESISASSYNWSIYLSYPYENDYDQNLQFESEDELVPPYQYIVSDGIPFIMKTGKNAGKNVLYLYCGYKHNLSVGDTIELSQPIGGKTLFEVYSIGDGRFGNDEKVLSVYNYGYENIFENTFGTFKRIIDINNSGETKSIYYCRKHKILTNTSDVNLSKMGYENNPFFVESKMQFSALTPNQVERLSYKETNQSYSFSFKKDIDISTLSDNNGLPITNLFLTIIKKGYVGWFNRQYPAGNNTCIQIGWDHNIMSEEVSGWWSLYNAYNRDQIPYDSYIWDAKTFYYNKDLEVDSVIKGDICEWNPYNQEEIVLSKMIHKINFNPNHFNDGSEDFLPNGYTYYPHYNIPTQVFSDYTETGDVETTDLVPEYSFYSEYDKQWRWKDIYPKGFIDTSGNGLDYPFINGSHYPFKEIMFLQTPLKRNINVFSNIVAPPNIDDCE